MSKEYLSKISEFYDKLVDKFNFDFRSGDHIDQAHQLRKYEALMGVEQLDYSSILEVGSGVGLFHKYLEETLFSFKYTGIEVSDHALRVAIENFPSIDFRKGDLLNSDFSEDEFEYVVVDGLFYLKFEGVGDITEYRNAMLKKMFELATKGVAVNFPSVKAENKDEVNMFYFSPGEVLDSCLRIAPKAILRHDYLPDNFTVYMYN